MFIRKCSSEKYMYFDRTNTCSWCTECEKHLMPQTIIMHMCRISNFLRIITKIFKLKVL